MKIYTIEGSIEKKLGTRLRLNKLLRYLDG